MRRALAILVALATASGGPDAPRGDLESQVKAAFAFNFLKFVEWPQAPEGDWVLGVAGDDAFADLLEKTVTGRNVNGRPVVVRRFPHITAAAGCQLLFVSRRDFEREGVPARPGLLTVGEAPGFVEAGGVINFYLEANKVRFEINPEAARAANLRISAQLLKLGTFK